MAERTCFVISPIGKENSDIRKHADSVFKNVIKPELSAFGFKVWRSDHRVKGNDIVDEMIENIRSADMCIVVLTGFNPNVMFEYGVRFQTGKPYILLKEKNDDSKEENKVNDPFDIYTQRRFEYDLHDVDSVTECRNKIGEKIRELLSSEEADETAAETHDNETVLEEISHTAERLSVENAASAAKVISDISVKVNEMSDRNCVASMHAAQNISNRLSEMSKENKAHKDAVIKDISDKIAALTKEIREMKNTAGSENTSANETGISEGKSVIELFIEREIINGPEIYNKVDHMANFIQYFIKREYVSFYEMRKDYLSVLEYFDKINITDNIYSEYQKALVLNQKAGLYYILSKKTPYKENYLNALRYIEDAISIKTENLYLRYNHLIIAAAISGNKILGLSKERIMEIDSSANKLVSNKIEKTLIGKIDVFYNANLKDTFVERNSFIWNILDIQKK